MNSDVEEDFLSFLSFFRYKDIEKINNVVTVTSTHSQTFITTILSSSQQYLTTHLSLFMQLVYQWNVGEVLLDAALNQINSFLEHPDSLNEGEAVTSVKLPLKKQKKDKGVQLSLLQSVSLLQAVVDDSISQSALRSCVSSRSSVYSHETLNRVHALLQHVIPSLKQYAFRDVVALPAEPEQPLTLFFRLLSLLLKEETFTALTQFLAESKKREEEDVQENSVITTAIPQSYKDLRKLLSESMLCMNKLGHFHLSLLHLFLSYSQRITTMGFIESEVRSFVLRVRGSTLTRSCFCCATRRAVCSRRTPLWSSARLRRNATACLLPTRTRWCLK